MLLQTLMLKKPFVNFCTPFFSCYIFTYLLTQLLKLLTY